MPAGLPRLADLTYRVLAARLVADHADFFPTLYLHDLAVVHDHFDRTVVDARNRRRISCSISGDSRLSVCPSSIRFASNSAIAVSPFYLFDLIDLIEQAAVAEVDRLRLFPAAEHLVDRE